MSKAEYLVFSADFEDYYPGVTPRVLAKDIHQWSKISANDEAKLYVASSEYLTAAYAQYKKNVDKNHLAKEPFDEVISSDRSEYLSWARNTENRLIGLAFVGGMTGETKYKDRVIEEMASVFEIGNWLNDSALAVSEMSTGIALAYDWLYNLMTPEERKSV